jgi:hypothetical protein
MFQKYNEQVMRSAIEARLRRELARFAFDGTETHNVINAELRGLEHEIAASNIRHANVSQFRDTVPVDIAIEIFLTHLEKSYSPVTERAPRRARRCVECGINWADPPSALCPGCQAYCEHQQ